jgi:mannose-1-phosphate guanylyltransferase/phosphomannomutase
VGNGAKWGISLTTVFEPRLLGTAGAVKNLESFFASEASFLVMYGDLLIDQDLGLLWSEHLNNKALATVLIHRRKGSNSIVSLDDSFRITSFVERPHHSAALADEHWVNSGVYAFSREILDFIPADSACDFPRDIFPKLLAADKVLKGFPLTGYRCAIDSPERYQQACQAFAAGKVTVAG